MPSVSSSDGSNVNLEDFKLLRLSTEASRYSDLSSTEIGMRYRKMDQVSGWENSSKKTVELLEEAYESAKSDAMEKGTLEEFMKKPVLICVLSKHGRLEGLGTTVGGQQFAHRLAKERGTKAVCHLEVDPYESGRWPARREHIRSTGEVTNQLKHVARTELQVKLNENNLSELHDVTLQTLHGEHLDLEIRGMYRNQKEMSRHMNAKRALAQGEFTPQLEADARLPAHQNQERGMIRAIDEDLAQNRSVILALAGPLHGPMFQDEYAKKCTVLTVAHFAGMDEYFDDTQEVPHVAERISYCLKHPGIGKLKGTHDAPVTSKDFQEMVRSLGLTDVKDTADYVSTEESDSERYFASESNLSSESGDVRSRSDTEASGGEPSRRRPSLAPTDSSSDSSYDPHLAYPDPESSSSYDSNLAYPAPGSNRSS